MDLISSLLTADPITRQRLYAGLEQEERYALMQILDDRLTNPWAVYADDPVGFVTEGLNESVWSRQRMILESVRDNKRTAVPACHAPGKSHIAARIVAWWVSCHPPGTALAVTTATTFRQVRNILWPHIRRVAVRHNLPGEVLTTEWKVDNELAGYGFSSSDHDETSVQGIHAPHLLVVVDEAGGVSEIMGRALEALMTGGHTRLLVIGNPAIDDEDSWFERACTSDLYNVIPIGAHDTPNFTGEDAGVCRSCPPNVPDHGVATHLVDQTWVDDVVSEFGDDSPFVEARVFARFPRSSTSKVIPLSWAERALENEDYVQSDEIRLGVDIASDGGDEFTIAWADGMRCSIRHKVAGSANENAVDVAGVILDHIRMAEAVHRERHLLKPVRVKIDATGLGWGVVGTLQRWKDEQMHSAEVIGVKVGERAGQAQRFGNQRAEMWWTGRELLQPIATGDGNVRQEIRLDVDRKTMAQLSAPLYKSDSTGRIVIEKKTEMKRRGINSPDRAEAILLALYEPPGFASAPAIAPLSFTQKNEWKM